MKAFHRIINLIIIAVLLAVTAPSQASTPEQVVSWDYHEFGGVCADGSPFGFWSHEGNSDNLLIVFQGGGLCWDAFTCQWEQDGFNDYYNSAVIGQDDPTQAGSLYNKGLLDLTNVNNPFGDWDVVQIPMCTGDLGVGNRTASYPNTRSLAEFAWAMNFSGAININVALNWIFATHPNVPTVGILGLSAGGPASIFHTPTIFNFYDEASVGFQISDSLAMVHLHQEVIEVWSGTDYLSPPNPEIAEKWSMAQQVIYTASAYPTRFFAEINSAQDATQALYEGVAPEQLVGLIDTKTGMITNAMLETESAPNVPVDNYRYWTHSQWYHAITIQSGFYGWAQNGINLYDWIEAISNGTPMASQHY